MKFKYFFIIFLLFSLYFVVWEKIGGFEKEKAESDFGNVPEWEASSEGGDLQKILSQRFTYLGKGVQSYAFLSADGTTVLKLFKHYHMWPSNQLFKQLPLPSSYREKVLAHREKRMARILGSCYLAFNEYRDEAGLLHLHLNKKKGALPLVTLTDRLGRSHYMDLNATEFVLQKRAEPLYATLDNWIKMGDLEQSKKAISSLFDLVCIRYEKKIKNKDPSLDRNFGLINGRAVQIDIGSLSRRVDPNPSKADREAMRTALRLKKWLGARSPTLSAFIDEEVQRVSERLR